MSDLNVDELQARARTRWWRWWASAFLPFYVIVVSVVIAFAPTGTFWENVVPSVVAYPIVLGLVGVVVRRGNDGTPNVPILWGLPAPQRKLVRRDLFAGTRGDAPLLREVVAVTAAQMRVATALRVWLYPPLAAAAVVVAVVADAPEKRIGYAVLAATAWAAWTIRLRLHRGLRALTT